MAVESIAESISSVGEAVGSGLSSLSSGVEASSGVLGDSLSGVGNLTSSASGPSVSGVNALPSGPEISVGGSLSPSNPGSVFDFGPEHQISGEIFSSDKTVSQPENVFSGSFFEVLAKPENPAPLVESKVNSLDIFGPKLSSLDAPVKEAPVSVQDISLLVVPQGDGVVFQSEEEVERVKKVAEEKKVKVDQEEDPSINEEKTFWQILLGDMPKVENPQLQSAAETEEKVQPVVKGEIEEETGKAVESELEVATQAVTLKNGENKGKIRVSTEEEDQSEEKEEPKEPLWEMSGKKEGQEEIAKRVLQRRLGVAKEIVEESVKETTQEGNESRYWFISKVSTRLGKIDLPNLQEALGMIFGRLNFSFVADRAKGEISKLKQHEITPGAVLESLQETLIKNPPVKPKRDNMENRGSLPESKLEKVSEEAAILAREGAEHIIYDPQVQRWIRVDGKPSQYPLELDETKKKVPIEPDGQSVDRKNSAWYTLYAQRAQARQRRRKAKS